MSVKVSVVRSWRLIVVAAASLVLVGGSAGAAAGAATPKTTSCTARGWIALYTDETRSALFDYFPINSAAQAFTSDHLYRYVLTDGDPRPGITVTGLVSGQPYHVEFTVSSATAVVADPPPYAGVTVADWRVSNPGDGVISGARNQTVKVTPDAERLVVDLVSNVNRGLALSGGMGIFCTP